MLEQRSTIKCVGLLYVMLIIAGSWGQVAKGSPFEGAVKFLVSEQCEPAGHPGRDNDNKNQAWIPLVGCFPGRGWPVCLVRQLGRPEPDILVCNSSERMLRSGPHEDWAVDRDSKQQEPVVHPNAESGQADGQVQPRPALWCVTFHGFRQGRACLWAKYCVSSAHVILSGVSCCVLALAIATSSAAAGLQHLGAKPCCDLRAPPTSKPEDLAQHTTPVL